MGIVVLLFLVFVGPLSLLIGADSRLDERAWRRRRLSLRHLRAAPTAHGISPTAGFGGAASRLSSPGAPPIAREDPRDSLRPRKRAIAAITVGFLAAALPLVGLVSLLLRSQLDPHFENYRAHFVVFGLVGGMAFILGYAAGEAANRRGDARVLLLSLAFMATGGFMGVHAIGTHGILFSTEHAVFWSPFQSGCW